MEKLPIEDNETNQLCYDTKEGIQESIKSLNGFRQLIQERYIAYKRGEQLNEFLVLRYYYLDGCGNCRTMTDDIIRNDFTELSDVLPMKDFWDYIDQHLNKEEDPTITFTMKTYLPDENIICPVCNKGWDINNCHDTVVRQRRGFVSLADFVGQTLLEAKKGFAGNSEAVYFMQPATLKRDDESIKYPESKEPWERNIIINGALTLEADGILNDYIILDGDEGLFNIWIYLHRECNRKHLEESAEEQFEELFKQAGFETINMVALPNKYCQCEKCAPWFNVQTEFGTILIGWRKSVINIDWSDIIEKSSFDILSLFKDENVSKDDTLIHACGWEKAEVYLSSIKSYLSNR